jgi:hypothetical protein
MAIVLNLAFNHFTRGNSDQQSVFAAGTERVLRYQDLAALREGDYFSDGKLHDCDGNEIPVVSEAAHAPVEHGPVRLKSSEHV